MPFKSAKRKSGASMSGATGRSSSGRVSRAGKTRARGIRTAGSKRMEIATPIVDEVTVVSTTAIDVVVLHQAPAQAEVFATDVFAIATVNPGVPTKAQLLAGEDSTGALAADATTAVAASIGNALSFIGLTIDTLYYFYFINVNDAGADPQYQNLQSNITQVQARTAAA